MILRLAFCVFASFFFPPPFFFDASAEEKKTARFGKAGIGVETVQLYDRNAPGHMGELIIVSSYNGSPSRKAKLFQGTIITHINGWPTYGRAYADSIRRILGEHGSQVRIRYRVRDFSNKEGRLWKEDEVELTRSKAFAYETYNIGPDGNVLPGSRGVSSGEERPYRVVYDGEEGIVMRKSYKNDSAVLASLKRDPDSPQAQFYARIGKKKRDGKTQRVESILTGWVEKEIAGESILEEVSKNRRKILFPRDVPVTELEDPNSRILGYLKKGAEVEIRESTRQSVRIAIVGWLPSRDWYIQDIYAPRPVKPRKPSRPSPPRKARPVLPSGGYATHRVRKKDTLYSLAKQHGTSVQKILQANPGVTANSLKVGTVLRIPRK